MNLSHADATVAELPVHLGIRLALDVVSRAKEPDPLRVPETSALQLYVSWPNLLLRADAGAVHVVWGSDDGGDTWNTLTR